jgi:hypothetical protein
VIEPPRDEERIAQVRLLFLERGFKMYSPRRLGGRKDTMEPACWVVRYARTGVYGAASAYGVGSTPLEATENAWTEFQATAHVRAGAEVGWPADCGD